MVSPPNSCRPEAGQKNAPAVHTGRGILFQHLVRADVHETQAAPGLNVLVAISADVEGRAAVEMAVTVVVMPMTVVSTVAMTMVSAVAMTTMPMTALTTRRSRRHGGSTERDSGDDGE